MTTEHKRKKVIEITIYDCPACGASRFIHHTLAERKVYKGKVVIGKFECNNCGWQSGVDGDI